MKTILIGAVALALLGASAASAQPYDNGGNHQGPGMMQGQDDHRRMDDQRGGDHHDGDGYRGGGYRGGWGHHHHHIVCHYHHHHQVCFRQH
jgi:opacity protein-like surface antigen